MNTQSEYRLDDNSRIAVIGGGPAGSFFTLYLLQYAVEMGFKPEVTIYQDRDFFDAGGPGCKGCAGVLSMSLLRGLADIGLTLPEQVIQSRIDHYTVHSPYTTISISNPERDIQIVSIYRGGGPRVSRDGQITGFDSWLLRQAADRGAGIVRERVTGIELGPRPRLKMGNSSEEYDLVVLAGGVNRGKVPVTGIDYVAPQSRPLVQDEIYLGEEEVESRLGNAAHAFFIPGSGLVFGTLVPKGPYVTVSVMSSGKKFVSIASFLREPLVRSALPENYERCCGCRPMTPVKPAANYYADRFVAVGDAAVTRLYKDGIGSARRTARQAALTVVRHGVSREAFRRYYQPYCRSIIADNRWGRFLFSVNDRTKNWRSFLLTQHRLIGNEQQRAVGKQVFTRAAWGMLTGAYKYREITRMVLGPVSLYKLGTNLLGESFRGITGGWSAQPRMLHVGKKRVLILGSGFGGAYVLRKLVPALNLNEHVETTMVSDENFFLFSPLLHEVAMGRIESRHVAYPIRRLQWRDRFSFVQATVTGINLAEKKVITGNGTFEYDYLVLALGGVAAMPGPDKVESDRNVFTLKTLYDSRLIRNHIINVFERAAVEKDREAQQRLLTFVISGAGYIGVQLVTELRDFIFRSLVKYYKSVDPRLIRIILVEREAKIISRLNSHLGRYALKQLVRNGIEVRFHSTITRIDDNGVQINECEDLPTSTIIWLSGAVASPRIAELPVESDAIGRIVVNDFLEVPGFPGVYALGDCAHFPDKETKQAIPRRAHITVRQAKVVARNILADIRGHNKRPYRYSRPPELVSLGVSRAMFYYRGIRVYGLAARLIWLGGYSLLVSGTYNRMRIIIDWTLSLVFGRDTSYIKTKVGKSG